MGKHSLASSKFLKSIACSIRRFNVQQPWKLHLLSHTVQITISSHIVILQVEQVLHRQCQSQDNQFVDILRRKCEVIEEVVVVEERRVVTGRYLTPAWLL